MIGQLFMVELTVKNWSITFPWYRDVLNLPLTDHYQPGQFALFQAGATGIALKAGDSNPGTILLTMQVDYLEEELQRLASLGVKPVEPLKTSEEGYRRALLRDPEGYRICLFEWLEKGE